MKSEIIKLFNRELNAKKCYDLIKNELKESIIIGIIE